MTAAVDTPRRAWVEHIMGLPISVHLRGPDLSSSRTGQHVAAVFAELRHADRVLSPYRDDSDLSRWQGRELELSAADPLLPAVLTVCAQARHRTGGYFDPRGLPDPRGGAPRYDPSGLVKGWAVQRAAGHLAGLGYDWCVNAGGDVLVDTAPGGSPWRIGIEDPTDVSRVARVVTVGSGAVATSGTVHRGAHLIDPYTRTPATAMRAVTVLGPSLLWADVYATAAAVRGPGALPWLAGLDGYEALLVERGGTVRTTAGWPT
jgi:thiamine biosynthesis lipoprotein